MRVAVVGYGVIGHLHAAILQKKRTLCAVCDINPHAMHDAPNVPKYTDYLTLLETVKPDAVHICTPHYLHAPMVIEALQRNVHVLCEKPLCIRAEEIDAILEAERRSRATLGVCLQNRYNAANRFVKDHLRNVSDVSGVGQVAWERSADYYASGPWRGKWASEGGGVLINQALHTLDLMQWFLGFPDEMTAQISNLSLSDVIEVEDSATLICRGTHPFTFFATNAAPSNFPVLIQLKADGNRITILPNRVLINEKDIAFANGANSIARKECYGNSHEALIADFYDCLSNGKHFGIDGAEGARVVRLILAAYESHGTPIRLSISKREESMT